MLGRVGPPVSAPDQPGRLAGQEKKADNPDTWLERGADRGSGLHESAVIEVAMHQRVLGQEDGSA